MLAGEDLVGISQQSEALVEGSLVRYWGLASLQRLVLDGLGVWLKRLARGMTAPEGGGARGAAMTMVVNFILWLWK